MYLDGRSFELGETLSGKDDNGNYINGEILGQIATFPAQNTGVASIRGQKRRKTGRPIFAIALRNISGGALTPSLVVSGVPTAATDFATSGYFNPLIEAVDGASGTANEGNIFIVDEYLPAAGVADDDIFWGIVGGLTTVITAASPATINIAIGDPVCSDGAGAVIEHTPATDPAEGLIGYALEASTANDDSISINACIRY